MDLKNNTILITGGSSGFGLEFVKSFLQLGNTVIITGRNQARLDQTKQLFPQVNTFPSDVSNPAAIKELFEKVTVQFPDLNILINNAGEMRKINLHDSSLDLEDINREIAINLSGPIWMVQQFLPHLKKQPASAILNVTSGLSLIPFPIAPIYGATKAGLRSYTKSLRVQLKKTNVKVFELAAPAASTPLADKFKDDTDAKMAMEPAKLIAQALKGMTADQYEIYPGLSKVLHFLSRMAPGLGLNMLSKPVDKMLASTNH